MLSAGCSISWSLRQLVSDQLVAISVHWAGLVVNVRLASSAAAALAAENKE